MKSAAGPKEQREGVRVRPRRGRRSARRPSSSTEGAFTSRDITHTNAKTRRRYAASEANEEGRKAAESRKGGVIAF